MAKKMYKNLTLTERMIRFVVANGWVEIDSRNKYRMFTKKAKPAGATEGSLLDYYMFIGKSGAVRINNGKSATGSYSQSERYAKALVAYETKNNLMGTMV